MSAQTPHELEAFLQQCQLRVNAVLEEKFNIEDPSHNLKQAMTYAVLGGGKRIRPTLVYGSVLAVGGNLAAGDAAACAVELIHSYSLVHDDLPSMDDDDLRRGRPTVHKAFDEATAILVGDALQSMAFEILSTAEAVKPDQALKMIQQLSQAAGTSGMVGGQYLDFQAVGTQPILAELEKIHNAKTGALIRASVLLGGLSCPQTSHQQLEALKEYATQLGLAFQVQDDILDETSDTETLGKPQGSDRELNKPTYVSLLGVDGAREKATELVKNAIKALGEFSEAADTLRNLAAFIVSRAH
jgi:geranylgeranyl diphosphate synthase type II